MSGIALTSAGASATPTVRAVEVLKDVLPGPPVTVREFARNDQIGLFAEFYENAPNAPPHSIELETTVRAEDGRVVFANREQRSSTDLQGKAAVTVMRSDFRSPSSRRGCTSFASRGARSRAGLTRQSRRTCSSVFGKSLTW